MKLRCLSLFVLLASIPAARLNGQTVPPNSQMTVKLLAPLSSRTNQAGDKISAQVIDPPAFNGDIVEGEVKKVKNGGKIHGTSVLNFTFETLYHQGKIITIESSVLSLRNSQGKENVDEEGEVIEKKNNVGKVALGSAIGAGLGGIFGGLKGAAIGAAAGLAGSLILIETTVKGPSIDFAPGSEFVLSVKERKETAQPGYSAPKPPPPAVSQAPVISSITPITSPRDTIIIHGSGFGDHPETVPLGDGSIDTVAGPNAPWLSVIQNVQTSANGVATSRGWGAGTIRGSDRNRIGVNLEKWTDTEIVLNGFGSALGPGQRQNMQSGDTLTFLICGPNNHCGMSYTASAATPDEGGANATVSVQPASAQPSGQPSGASIQAFVQAGRTSLALPAGNYYIYGMVTGGGAPSGPFAIHPGEQVVDGAGVISASLSSGQNSQNSFATNTGYYVIGGASVTGSWLGMDPYYGSNAQPGAANASVSFPVVANSLVVVIGLASSQQSVELGGLPALSMDAASSGPGAVEGMVIAHAYLKPGEYTAIMRSSALSAGQAPAHMADLIGVFVFRLER